MNVAAVDLKMLNQVLSGIWYRLLVLIEKQMQTITGYPNRQRLRLILMRFEIILWSPAKTGQKRKLKKRSSEL